MGRKKVDRTDKIARSFETTKMLDARLINLAKKKNITVSKLIREILEKFFEDREII